MLAYLVIREGSKWSDVFRLVAGRTVTIGRAPTNQIVIKDERCSRHHAEIFFSQDKWTLRDLESRNGTMVGDQRVHGDRELAPGEVIRIAHAQLCFVHDLSDAFPENPPGQKLDETVLGQSDIHEEDEDVLSAAEPTTITHRKGQTRFHNHRAVDEDTSIPRLGRAAAKLCRLAFELANQPDLLSVANHALEGLLEGTNSNAGALLLVPVDFPGVPSGSDLEVISSRTADGVKYHRLSNFLATMVLREGEAVLARNVEGDSRLASRDSHGEIHATSVLCAPIRQDGKVIGLIHLYSTKMDLGPDPEDLEFSLAVADNVALALKTLGRQAELAENLNVSQGEVKQLRRQLGSASEIVGTSRLMMQVQQEISRAGPSRATVLIRGESGVGKELVARAVHFSSPRRKGPFVCLNCAALSESLLESELFGHERGAFTGAVDRKMGRFEMADKGTLMLDEIGEMSPTIQAKFLRVLEGHPFERVGGSRAIKVDVRVIAATNRDLEKAVSEGTFRRDLYFRLRVLEIVVPPLRKRSEDTISLAEHFLRGYASESGRKLRGFTPEAREQLMQYRWPGNVRELKNVVERAVILARGDYVDIDDLNLSNIATVGDSAVMPLSITSFEPMTLDEMERRHILATLRHTNWNKSKTARLLGVERSTLDRKIRRFGLMPDSAQLRAQM